MLLGRNVSVIEQTGQPRVIPSKGWLYGLRQKSHVFPTATPVPFLRQCPAIFWPSQSLRPAKKSSLAQ
jgi:hypothetical protein